MAATIQLEVVTPERLVVQEEVDDITMPGKSGYLGILPGHAPLITEIAVGEITYHSSGQTRRLSVAWGFAEVLPDRVSVLAETAEFAEEIDLARAQAALKRAQERIAQGGENLDWDRATLALARALLRIQVVSKHQGVNIASAR